MTAHIELWKVASDGTIAAVPQPTNALDSGKYSPRFLRMLSIPCCLLIQPPPFAGAAYVLLGNQDPRRVFAWIGSSATQVGGIGVSAEQSYQPFCYQPRHHAVCRLPRRGRKGTLLSWWKPCPALRPASCTWRAARAKPSER